MANKMSPEHRWISRGIVGAHMNTAEGHLRALEHAKADPHVAYHRESAVRELKHAEEMVGHLRDALSGDEGGDEMRTAKRTLSRTPPEKAPQDLRERFQAVSDAVKAYDVVTASEVLRTTVGTDDPEKADAHISALQVTEVRYKKLRTEQETNREDHAATERETIVKDLLDREFMTPAIAQRARTEKWTLTRLGEFKAKAEGAEPMGPGITRVAPLRPVEGTSGNTQTRNTPVSPAELPPRARGEGRNGGEGGKKLDVVAAMAERAGLDPKKVQERFQDWQDGKKAVGFGTGGQDHF